MVEGTGRLVEAEAEPLTRCLALTRAMLAGAICDAHARWPVECDPTRYGPSWRDRTP
jgi:hypothetical protein